MSDEKLGRYVEPIMHLVPLTFGIATSSASVRLDLFNNADLWCWIASFPFGCRESFQFGSDANCIRGDNAFVYRWGFFYAPLWTTALLVFAVNVVIYMTVKKREREAHELHTLHHVKHGRPLPPLPGIRGPGALIPMDRFSPSFRGTSHARGTSVVTSMRTHGNDRALNQSHHLNPISQPIDHCRKACDDEAAEENVNGDENKNSFNRESMPMKQNNQQSHHENSCGNEKKTHRRAAPSFFGFDRMRLASSVDKGNRHTQRPSLRIVLPAKLAEALKSHGIGVHGEDNDNQQNQPIHLAGSHNSIASADIRHVIEIIEDYPSAARQNAAAYQFGAKLVVYQCLAYTFGFYTVWFWSSVSRVVQQATGRSYFALLFLQCFFEPLQGLMNAVVYRFASYLRLQQRYPHLNRWECFYYTWRWGFLGPPPEPEPKGPSQARGISRLKRLSSLLAPSGRASYSSRMSRTTGRQGCNGPSSSEIGILDDHLGGVGLSVGSDSKIENDESNFVAVLSEESFLDSAEEHLHSLMADLMTSYADNPAMLNEPMATVRSEFPLFDPYSIDAPLNDTFFMNSMVDKDRDVMIPDQFPILTTNSTKDAGHELWSGERAASMAPMMNDNMVAGSCLGQTDFPLQAAGIDDDMPDAIARANVEFRIPSDPSSTLVSRMSMYSSSSDSMVELDDDLGTGEKEQGET